MMPGPEPGRRGENIYGRQPVLEAIRGKRRVLRIHLAATSKPSRIIDEIIKTASERLIPIDTRPQSDLESLVGDVLNQGVVAEVSEFLYADIGDVIAAAALKTQALIVILDGVTDPQNFGAIVRTAAAADADAVILPKHGSAPVTPVVVKASAGVVEHAVIVRANPNSAIDKLKKAGFWIVGADADAPAPVWELDLSGKVGLVFGSEGEGLSRLVRSKCDFLAKLPLAAPVKSLNVSAAAAVMIYESVRQKARI